MPEVVDAWRLSEAVRVLALNQPPAVDFEQLAGGVVDAVAAGGTPNLLDAGRQAYAAEFDMKAAAHAQRVAEAARELAASRATNLAADLAGRIIVEHLRPALEAVYEEARECGKQLDGYGLDPHLLLTAPASARKAFSHLAELVVRRRLIFIAAATSTPSAP